MAYLVMYNRADNNPVYKHHWSSYIPLQKVTMKYIILKHCLSKALSY